MRTTSGRTALALIAITAGILGAAGAEKTTVWSFETESAGATPADFAAKTGRWVVVEIAGIGKALAQTAESSDDVFNVALATKSNAKDLRLSVKLRAVSGVNDQGGGVVWRAKDAKNYYIARYNPLENNFRVYKVEGGKRTMFKSVDVKLSQDWHTIKVAMRGDHIACTLDGAAELDVHDATFADAGMVGLWSKSDARTEFDDLTLTEL